MIDSLAPAEREGRVEREPFLRRLEGMVYGPDPRHGFFRGSRFVHPELAIRVDFPADWPRRNMARLVVAASPEKDGRVQMTVADTAP